MHGVIFWMFAAVVALAPLPFGGNQPWGWSLIALALGALVLLWGLAALVDRSLLTLRSRRTLPYAGLFLLLCLWFALQSVSFLPAGLRHPAWAQAAWALDLPPDWPLGEPLAAALGLAPDRAWTALMRLVSYAAAFWLGLYLLRRRGPADRFLWMLVLAGVGYALYGLVVHLDEEQTVLWIEKYSYRESLTSTFINRNNYAAYAGMGLVVTVGLLLDRLRRIELPAYLGWRGRLVRFLDSLGFGVWVLAASFLVLLAALLLSGSRGGLLATLVGLIAVFLSLGRTGASRGRAPLRMALAAVALVALGTFVALQSGSLMQQRMEGVVSEVEGGAGSRLALYGLALEAIAERPLSGSGLGSFPAVYQSIRGEETKSDLPNQVRAHNSYLEIAVEGGVPAALLLYGTLGAILLLQLRALRRPGVVRRFPAIAAAATLLFAAHSLIDFPLQMPGTAVTFAALLGLGLAQSYPHRRPQRSEPAAAERPWRPRGSRSRERRAADLPTE